MKSTDIGNLNKKEKPQRLVNLDKERYFRNSYELFKSWDEKPDSEKFQNPMEMTGIYCICFSMLEDRLETLWWNCCYVHEWGVYGPRGSDYRRPPSQREWENRKIPQGIRTSGFFRRQLLENKKITDKLNDRIQKSEDDRREIIHRNMFFMKDLNNKHIQEVMKIFRELDRLVQKHKKGHPDKLM